MPRSRMLTPSASPMHFFGSEARRAREAAGMTQSELGELVPCDKATVSRVEAVALRWFEHSLVPGLLQTEDYARAVLKRHPKTTNEQVDERVAARLAR